MSSTGADLIAGYFPEAGPEMIEKYSRLESLYSSWNDRINVISRKDLPNLYLNHVLHSLSLAKVISALPGETFLDIGTGGGFPGLPLAILFPHAVFTLIDATGKKIRVVRNIAAELDLGNVEAIQVRAEEYRSKFHYIISRAVTSLTDLVRLSRGKFSDDVITNRRYGLYCLKGGDLSEEIAGFEGRAEVHAISDYFSENFFSTKSIIFLPAAEVQ